MMPLRRPALRPALVFLLAALGLPAPARAADPMVGIRSLAMGDSLRATATGSEGLLLNPAGIAVQRQFSSSGFYSFRSQSNGHFLHASVSDSVTQQYLALGVYYNYIHETPNFGYRLAEGGGSSRVVLVHGAEVIRTGYEAGMVLAIPFAERFSLGATLKYGNYTLNSPLHPGDVPDDFTYQNPAIDAEKNVDLGSLGNVVSFDVGVSLRLIGQLRVGVVGQNLWGHGTELPTRLGIGLGYPITDRLLVAADAMIDFTGNETCTSETNGLCTDSVRLTTYRLGGGIEYVAAGMLPLRAGYLYDSLLSAHHVSGGLGYLDPNRGFGIDFSLRQRVSAGTETVFLLGLRLLRN